MGSLDFTGSGARAFAAEGRVEEWVHLFLNSVGNNAPFSEGLKLQQRFWVGPVLLHMTELSRCCGPERDMEYVMPRESWDRRVGALQELLRQGWDMPPLIAQNCDGRLSIRDGNHRHEALVREGADSCWVILWDSDSQANLSRWADSHGAVCDCHVSSTSQLETPYGQG